MPIYAYKCTACGHAQDVLQKISDKPLTVCPECHQETYAKQVTAAGFQLKGSGWYVTDFRQNGGGAKTSESAPAVTAADGAASAASTGSEIASSPSNGSASAPAATSASNTSASSSGTSSSPTPVSSTSSSSKPAAGGSAA